ncbi:MAG: hypothetical protein AABW49_02625 [Nanoarchaeota archaeon]
MVSNRSESYEYSDSVRVTREVFNSLLYMAETHLSMPHKKPPDISIKVNRKIHGKARIRPLHVPVLELSSLLSPESIIFHEAVHYLAYREDGLFWGDNIGGSIFSTLLNETLAELATYEVYGYGPVYRIDFFDKCQNNNIRFSNGVKIDKAIFDMLRLSCKVDVFWAKKGKQKDKKTVLKEFIELCVDNKHKLDYFIKIRAVECAKSLRNADYKARTLMDRYKHTERDEAGALIFYVKSVIPAMRISE